ALFSQEYARLFYLAAPLARLRGRHGDNDFGDSRQELEVARTLRPRRLLHVVQHRLLARGIIGRKEEPGDRQLEVLSYRRDMRRFESGVAELALRHVVRGDREPIGKFFHSDELQQPEQPQSAAYDGIDI